MTESFKLHFKGPLHIGSGNEEMDKTSIMYHSDALKSAIYSIGISLFEEWKEASFFFNAVKLSSCFPYINNDFFLPRPFINFKFNFSKTSEDKSAKKAKKIEFISGALLQKWFTDNLDSPKVNEEFISNDGAFLFFKNTPVEIFRSEIQQRVAVPREGNSGDAKPFYLDRIFFAPDAGLYFLAQFDNEVIRSQFIKALSILGDNGIGTDRTVGNGLFTFDYDSDIGSFELPGTGALNKKVNLGLYLPIEEEINTINLEDSAWQLKKRGGYIAGSTHEKFLSLRKKSIYFFSAGSAFKTVKQLNGRVVDLKPEFNDTDLHSIWRDGQPIFLNL